MDEGHQLIVCVAIRLFVDEFDALFSQSIQFGLDVIHLQGNVMDAFPFLFDELGNLTVGLGGLEEFNMRSLGWNERENELPEIFPI